ncbi:MAG: NAD(P)H-hydrate dehydratase [Gemmataceae bacterium]|nr:NAD(P)H-hydrate dehydratase [Gemmataceae bacterium]
MRRTVSESIFAEAARVKSYNFSVSQSPLETSVAIPRLTPRAPDSHKGTYGRALIVAGSRGMSGAAVLSGSACLRGGAGLVQVAVPGEILSTVAAGNPCYMTTPLAQDLRGRLGSSAIDELVALGENWADVIAIGPGLGQAEAMPAIIAAVVERFVKPLVIDADGLNALAKLDSHSWQKHRMPIVLTPHPGEFARLTGCSSDDVRSRRQELASQYAANQQVVLVLKGHNTLVTDGKRAHVNPTGNPGMATGGSGDVLTGLIAALIGQGLEAFDAAVLGAWVHGRAGDLAAEHFGQTALIASDLLTYLPPTLREVGG